MRHPNGRIRHFHFESGYMLGVNLQYNRVD